MSIFDYDDDPFDLFDVKPSRFKDECFQIPWETWREETRFRHPWRFLPGKQFEALRRVTSAELLETLMKTMPCVVDIEATEFERAVLDKELGPLAVSDENFWTWSGYLDEETMHYIFTFETPSDAMRFGMYYSAL